MAKNGTNGGRSRQPGAPLPHIDDIIAYPTDLEPRNLSMSLKRMVDTCESSLSSAEMSREFKRPAIALKDYIKASIIAVMLVKQHPEYPSMQANRAGDLFRRHSAALKQIQSLYDTYEGLKEYIRQDNAVTKVQPTKPRSGRSSATNNGSTSSARPSQDISRPAGHLPPAVNGISSKAKPVLKPKPQSLHGNALSSQHGRTPSAPNAAMDALSARFAGLRGPQASPGQDPRIRTHSFVQPPRPSGPREMPPTQKPKIGIDSSVPALPKMPDAIYSPVRGNMSQESASLPTSTPRGFSRTGSGTSNAGTPIGYQPPRKDYFSPVIANAMSAEPSSIGRPSMDTASAVSSPRMSMELATQKSRAETIEADELFQAMKTAGSVLIIDVRTREDYDEGHIMSSSTMCIEPAILTRKDLSADDILQSLVLHDAESKLFERRHEFDLVVYYDRDSKAVPRVAQGPTTYALMSLYRALVHLSFECALKQQPKMLSGGLESWIDLLGANSLQQSPNSHLKNSQGPKKQSPYQYQRLPRKTSKYNVQPLDTDEARAWQETLNNEHNESASHSFYQTQEDFIRKFPAVPIEPEDMAPSRNKKAKPASPPGGRRGHPYKNGREARIDQLASPPQRPAPAVPRPSHSGLAVGAYHGTDANGSFVETSQTTAVSDFMPKMPSGLHNPRNWCYSNSVLQAMLATRFGRLLGKGDWKTDRKVPMKNGETIESPRLMMMMIHSIFNHMYGPMHSISPELLMKFCHAVCTKGGEIEIFGDREQHDASEYFTFLLSYLHDESNLKRDIKDMPDPKFNPGMSYLQFASNYWQDCYSKKNRSLVDEHFGNLTLSISQCSTCHNKTPTPSAGNVVNVSLPEGLTSNKTISLGDGLNTTFGTISMHDYKCDNCNTQGNATLRMVLASAPETLCLSLVRFQTTKTGDILKNEATVTWDLNDFDMSPWFLRPDECQWQPRAKEGNDSDQSAEKLGKSFCGQFRYETVAVVQHQGRTTRGGHYTALVRDNTTQDRNAWLVCNDTRVSKKRLDDEKSRNQVFKDGVAVPYMIMLQRKDF